MKIIREGAKPKWWVGKQITCSQCCCTFELEPADTVKEYRLIAAKLIQIYVSCPHCGQECRLYFQ